MANPSLIERLNRQVVRTVLSPFLGWRPLQHPKDGFSIILGVPWDLRHLLPVNLRFVEKTDISELRTLFVVFDRCKRPEMEAIESEMRDRFPSLPLQFLHYPALSGAIIERIHVSTFYNSMNVTYALGQCQTRYAILHDFDLFPLSANHFTSIVNSMADNGWRFSGHELTHFDGLKDQDLQIGTWTLGVDAEWLRNHYRPLDCFHCIAKHNGQWYQLDPFAWIQFQTSDRGLTEQSDCKQFCHVKNLCSTYLRFIQGKKVAVAWRLHYLWYLEELAGQAGRLSRVEEAMDGCQDGILRFEGQEADFRNVHGSCANVLRDELMEMDSFLFAKPRDITRKFVDSFEIFVHRVGDISEIRGSDGVVRWSPKHVNS